MDRFDEFVNNDLFRIHCQAHRLNLALRDAFDDITYMFHFEEMIKDIALFYNSQNHKRKSHLRELAYELELEFLEMN